MKSKNLCFGLRNFTFERRKILTLLVLMFCIIGNIDAQKERKNYIGASFSYGLSRLGQPPRIGGFGPFKQYDMTSYNSLDLKYSRFINQSTEFCTGLMFNLANVKVANYTEYDDIFGMISIPANFKFHFAKYFYGEGGLLLSKYFSMGYEWGFGLNFGLGAEYVFKSGMTLSAGPIAQLDCLNLMQQEIENRVGLAYLYQFGIKIGIGYRF